MQTSVIHSVKTRIDETLNSTLRWRNRSVRKAFYFSYLFLIYGRAERPYASECKVQLVPFLRAIDGRVGRHQNAFEQMAQHLYVRHLRYGNDFLEPVANVFQTRRYVFVEQYHEVALLRDVLPRLDPTRHVPVQWKRERARYNRTLFSIKTMSFFLFTDSIPGPVGSSTECLPGTRWPVLPSASWIFRI